jgi:cell division protein FtsI (penicillin-binding protein 3)
LKKEKRTDISRAYLIFIFTCLVAMAIVVRIVTIQWGEAAEWTEMAENFVTEYRGIEAVRGNILSDDGSLLATSLPLYDIRMDLAADGLTDKVFKEGVDSLAIALSALFNDRSSKQYRQELIDAHRDAKRYYRVKKDVDYNQVQLAKTFPIFKLGRFKGGVIYEKHSERRNPFGELAHRTIGKVNENSQAVGLEAAYSEVLSGVDGKRLERRLIGGQWMPVQDGNDIEPEDGLDILTSIDINIQDVAHSALLRQMEANEAGYGTAVLMEVETGFIKAISNITKKGDRYVEDYNYAVGAATEPGSTFKLPALLAAMEEGVVSIYDSVDTRNGRRRYFDRTMHDSNDKGYGRITVQRAFELSSNVGISSVVYEGFQKDPQRFVDRIHSMGLGTTLGLEIPGEGQAMVKSTSDKTWSGVTLPWMSIGYETLITPLQTLAFYNAIANNGVMVRPQFVSEYRRGGDATWTSVPVVLNPSIASQENIKACQLMLEGVVEHGTASNLINPDYKIAGKTGTAQIANDGTYGRKGEHSYQASFVGYFPADNPQYSCIVLVSAPSNSIYYGNLVAGPVFKEIADKIFAKRFDLQKQPDQKPTKYITTIPVSKDGGQLELTKVFSKLDVAMESSDLDASYVHTTTESQKVSASALTVHEGKVPNVKGMGLSDAVHLLENQGIAIEVSGRGFVKEQSLPPGTIIREGMRIQLELTL